MSISDWHFLCHSTSREYNLWPYWQRMYFPWYFFPEGLLACFKSITRERVSGKNQVRSMLSK